MIAHLKDQLQETKAKTSMETKYIKKDAEVSITWYLKMMYRVFAKAYDHQLCTDFSELPTIWNKKANLNVAIYFTESDHIILEMWGILLGSYFWESSIEQS